MKSILQIYDLEKGQNRILKTFDTHIEAPNWTLDGRSLVYNSYGRIYSYDIESGVNSQIDTGACLQCNNDHVLSFDGKYLAISSGFRSRIYILPLKGGKPRLVTLKSPSYLHGWSPDGSVLSYCAKRKSNYDIYVISADGGPEKRLTTAEGLDDGPEYSPDGKYIWFNSVRSGLMQIWRMECDGSNQVQMTDDAFNNWFPHVSPDGKRVVFVSYFPNQVKPGDHPANKDIRIRMMSPDGGEITTLLEAFGGQGTMNVNSWAPNSCEFAFVTYEQD